MWICTLRMLLDLLLHLDLQMAAVTRHAFHQLHLLRKLQPFLSDSNLTNIIHAFITLRLDYSTRGCSEDRMEVHSAAGAE